MTCVRYIELNEMVGYDEKFESVTLSDLWKYNNIFGGKDTVGLGMQKI